MTQSTDPDPDHPMPIPMTPLTFTIRLALIGVTGYCWWTYNIVQGNAIAIADLGLFVGIQEWARQRLIPLAGSLTQLYWDTDLDWGVLRHPFIGIFCVVVGLFDTLGPAYAFLLTTGRTFTLPNLVLALGWGFFFSVVVQEVAWRLTKDVLAALWAALRDLFRPRPRRLPVEESTLAPPRLVRRGSPAQPKGRKARLPSSSSAATLAQRTPDAQKQELS